MPAPSSHSDSTSKKKRKRNQIETENTKQKRDKENYTFDKYKEFSRWTIRSENLAISWYDVFEEGLKLDAKDSVDRASIIKRYPVEISTYRRLHEQIPHFSDDIKKMLRKPKFEKQIYAALFASARGARADDSNSLLSDGLQYVGAYYGPLDPPISSKQPKSDVRGFNHPLLARLLCPVDYLNEFDQDPAGFRDKLLNGVHKVHSTDFPVCLYDESQIDPDDPSAGLFWSKILVAFWKHIFIGPSSALKEKPGGIKAKRGQAQKNGMKVPTPGLVMYSATQLRWCFSASDDWRLEDCNWRPDEFYRAGMRLFGISVSGEGDDGDDNSDEEGDSEWGKELLAWFAEQVFGVVSAADTTTPARGSTLDSILAKRRAQKQAKLAAASNLAAAVQGASQIPPAPNTIQRQQEQEAAIPWDSSQAASSPEPGHRRQKRARISTTAQGSSQTDRSSSPIQSRRKRVKIAAVLRVSESEESDNEDGAMKGNDSTAGGSETGSVSDA